jgi:hypothetical protein
MMEKSALAGEGGGCTPTPGPFHSITIKYKVAVYTPAERADTLPVFSLYPICTLWFGPFLLPGKSKIHIPKNTFLGSLKTLKPSMVLTFDRQVCYSLRREIFLTF